MTQEETRAAVQTAFNGVSDAYWGTSDEDVRDQLMALAPVLDSILTSLNQESLAQRTKEFDDAASLMKGHVMPMIQKLDASVARLMKIDDATKVALADLMKVSLAASFFKIPTI